GALGFDGLVCDLGWIRAIQYFGGNFTTLDKPEKREGFVRLVRTLVTLDEHFLAAWKFGGFAFHESVKDATMAVNFLAEGSDKNPTAWDLAFDAGFISYYQLGNTEQAKRYFEQAYSTSRFTSGKLASLTFQVLSESEGNIGFVQDSDSGPSFEISGLVGPIPSQIASAPPEVGAATTVIFGALHREESTATFDIDVQNNTQKIAEFSVRVAYDASVYRYKSSIAAGELGYGTFTVEPAGNGQLLVRGDYVDPNCPSYVPRMAIEMDLAAGKFISAWEQYSRYYGSAMQRGDEISARIASDKLSKLYSTRAIELLSQAVKVYHQEKGMYPSTDMHELLDSGILLQIINNLLKEEPDQAAVLNVLTYGTADIRHLFSEWHKPDAEKVEPHILIVETTDGTETPVIQNRFDLLSLQKSAVEQLQYAVKTLTEEKGHPLSSLQELMAEEWFKRSYPDGIPESPLGGEYYLDPDGKVQVRDLKY
ncbi:MAG: hypothetical protein ABIH23_17595, partial [bacterium]